MSARLALSTLSPRTARSNRYDKRRRIKRPWFAGLLYAQTPRPDSTRDARPDAATALKIASDFLNAVQTRAAILAWHKNFDDSRTALQSATLAGSAPASCMEVA